MSSDAMDISVSPSTSTQCPEESSSPTMKTLYSKIISSCKKNERISCSITPENKSYRTGSPFTSRKVPFNPFNHNLKERLENPILSPNVFSTVISPSQDSEVFKWTIDDLSKINPAPIEEEFHYEEYVDERTETEIQTTIDKYFTKTHMPSPWNTNLPTNWSGLREIFKAEGTICSNEHSNMTVASSSPCSFSLSRLQLVSKDSFGSFHDVSTQTALSLPPDLPESINTALKPYFTEDNVDDINLSMNSLRRKLFFHQEEVSSPVRYCSSVDGSPKLNRCYPSTPLFQNRTEDSPVQIFSPLDLSPIGSFCDKPCNSSCSKFQMRTPLRAIENKQCHDLKLEETPNTKRFNQECFKIFESPKLAGHNRRSRKRRRSSQDLSMSVSNSFFSKQKVSAPKRSFGESRMLVDNSNDILAESQDTGYQTESASHFTFGTEKNFFSNNSNIKSLALECWKKENKENHMISSTPTKN